MNKKGFTLIEILAVIIIISIVATIGIAAISSSVDKSRKSDFANLAKTYAESARSMRGQDKLPHDPKKGEVVIIKVSALNGTDKNEDYDTAYGEVVKELSYVAIVNDNYDYYYYVTVIDTSRHCILNADYSVVSDKSVAVNYNSDSVFNFATVSQGSTVTINSNNYTVTAVHDNYVVAKK